jgi:plastocyanin
MRMKFSATKLAPTLLAIGLLAMLTIMITACAGGTTAAGNSPNTVHMNDTNFDQSSITIKKGESLTLVNDVSTVHIIENGTWDNNGTPKPDINIKNEGAPVVDAQMNGGDSRTFGPFNTAGTFQLYCTVHNGMNLTVIVK